MNKRFALLCLGVVKLGGGLSSLAPLLAGGSTHLPVRRPPHISHSTPKSIPNLRDTLEVMHQATQQKYLSWKIPGKRANTDLLPGCHKQEQCMGKKGDSGLGCQSGRTMLETRGEVRLQSRMLKQPYHDERTRGSGGMLKTPEAGTDLHIPC